MRVGVARPAALVAVAAAVTATWALAGRAATGDVLEALGTDAFGGVMLAVAQLALVPNLVLWALSWLTGTGLRRRRGDEVRARRDPRRSDAGAAAAGRAAHGGGRGCSPGRPRSWCSPGCSRPLAAPPARRGRRVAAARGRRGDRGGRRDGDRAAGALSGGPVGTGRMAVVGPSPMLVALDTVALVLPGSCSWCRPRRWCATGRAHAALRRRSGPGDARRSGRGVGVSRPGNWPTTVGDALLVLGLAGVLGGEGQRAAMHRSSSSGSGHRTARRTTARRAAGPSWRRRRPQRRAARRARPRRRRARAPPTTVATANAPPPNCHGRGSGSVTSIATPSATTVRIRLEARATASGSGEVAAAGAAATGGRGLALGRRALPRRALPRRALGAVDLPGRWTLRRRLRAGPRRSGRSPRGGGAYGLSTPLLATWSVRPRLAGHGAGGPVKSRTR